MKKITRRDRLKIYGDLYRYLSSKVKKEKIGLTRVQVKIRVSFDRLKTTSQSLVT